MSNPRRLSASSTIHLRHHAERESQAGSALQPPRGRGEYTSASDAERESSDFVVNGISSEFGDLDHHTKFGLLGLLDVIRMTNADLNTLALGSDLTTLGLNLNSADCLYSTFASPWAEAPTMREPQFSLPMCYYMQPPPLKTSHLSKFQLETLFYIFYAMPKDVLQAYSAQELYNRDWQYHQDLKLWFKRGSATDGLSTANNQYIYFDIKSWECRLFSGPHAGTNILAGLLLEDDVRVKLQAA
jgi:CCR4-NOT transcription complex subunit 2